jgi:hypothetical protein
MRRGKITVGMVLLALVAAAIASASTFHQTVRQGNLVIEAEGGFKPEALPKHKNAPIKAYGGGSISTANHEIPPILDSFTLEFDRHGAVDTTHLPFCKRGRLVATDVKQARAACGDAIVGEGYGRAVVKFEEQGPINVASPITLFNGPKQGGNDTIIAHAFLTYPAPTTFIVPIVIEKIHKGVFGYRVNVRIPKIAGGYGHPLAGKAHVGRMWTYKGKQHSYINARCETGHFSVRGEFKFKEVSETLRANFILPCKVRK